MLFSIGTSEDEKTRSLYIRDPEREKIALGRSATGFFRRLSSLSAMQFADTPEVFSRPWRDFGSSLSPPAGTNPWAYCLSPAGPVRQGKISAKLLIFMQHTAVEKRLIMVE